MGRRQVADRVAIAPGPERVAKLPTWARSAGDDERAEVLRRRA